MNETLILDLNEKWILGPGESLTAPADGTLTIVCYGDSPGPGPGPDPELPEIVLFVVEQLDGFPLTALAEWRTDGDLVTIDWGDGSPAQNVTAENEKTHVYNRTGTFTVTLTARNGVGAVTARQEIVIRMQPPDISAFSVERIPGTPLAALAEWEAFAVSCSIDWGDGYGDGPFADSGSATHAYRQIGRYFVTLTAANEEGEVTETRIIEIVVTASGLAAVYSRFSRLAFVKTSLGKGDMA